MEQQPVEPVTPSRQPTLKVADGSMRGALPSPFRERRLVVALLVAIVVLGSFFISPMFRGRICVHGDLGLHLLPMRKFYAECLKQGQAFDWTPQIFGGCFLTGDGQHGPYHPLHWLLYRWLPLDIAFPLETFLPFPVFAAGVIVFLRRYIGSAGAAWWR